MNYYTADTHFGDKRLNLFPRYFNSPEEMEELLIENWNNTVSNSDTVYHLGDVLVDESKFKLISRLNGKKTLIRGNYDVKYDNQRFLDSGFDKVVDSLIMDIGEMKVNLVHYPSKGVSNMFNLVGHIHGAWRVQKNMINVGVDAWHYFPISENDVLFFFNAIDKFYDGDVWAAYNKANVKNMSRGKEGEAASGTLNEIIKLKDLLK